MVNACLLQDCIDDRSARATRFFRVAWVTNGRGNERPVTTDAAVVLGSRTLIY